jgi:hypothetical protein
MAQKSSNRLIRKLLFANQDKKQMFFAFFGVLIGFVFISISTHYLIQLYNLDKSSDILNSNTITIQKKVSSSSTLSISNNTFSKEEIVFYDNLSFIEKVVSVENNDFPVELKSDDPLVPYFRSDIYIQSIPSNFLDVKSTLWKWDKEDKTVPIILPRDFVYMMNNFLSSAGMPQLSDEILKDVKFKIQLGNDYDNFQYNAKIIGFTNEISSILVPENFMTYGSEMFGEKMKKKCTQLMLKSKKGKFGLVEELIKKNHLEVKKNQLIEGKLKSMLTILLSSISFISLVVVILSMIVLIQYLQLLITKNAYEIRTILRLGYTIKSIVIQYVLYVFLCFLIVMFIIILVDVFSFIQINKLLKTSGLVFESVSYLNVVMVLLFLFLTIFISSIISVYKFVYKEF